MNNESTIVSNSDDYLSALQLIAIDMTAVIQKFIELYRSHRLVANPEDFITISCDWLGYIVGKKINGDKLHIQNLINNTMIEQLDKGKILYQFISNDGKNDNVQIDELVQDHGLIIVPVIKLSQFISKEIQKMLNIKPRRKKKFNTVRQECSNQMEEFFDDHFVSVINGINSLKIPNPLIFFLENISVMLGWLAGFFSQMCKRSDQSFLEEGLLALEANLNSEILKD